VRVRAAIRASGQLRPIQVYKIGEVYFVLDGNHRVSVARERGVSEIPAYVTEIHTKININPETDLDDLILKAEYADFLEKTRLDETCPQFDLTITAPGQYPILEGQIELLRQQKEQQINQQISIKQAAQNWCQNFYTPVIKIMRERGIMKDFPDRTETDLYVWILKHQKKLKQDLGWKLEPTVVATDISDRHGSSPSQIISRLVEKIQKYFVPDVLKTGPRPGRFRARQEKIHAHDPAHLFTHILIPLNGKDDSWQALNSANVQAIRERFETQCQDVGLPGELAVDTGPIVPTICKHARLSDLVIIHMAHPPDSHPIMRAESGIRKLIQQSPRPLLTIPQVPEKISRLLVAYNGNPRSREALYAAAYFAGRWEVPLFVLIVAEPEKINPKKINHARYYLRSRQIPATYIQKKGQIAEVILEVQAEQLAVRSIRF